MAVGSAAAAVLWGLSGRCGKTAQRRWLRNQPWAAPASIAEPPSYAVCR